MNMGFTAEELMGGLKKERQLVESVRNSPTLELSPTIVLGLTSDVDCFKAIKELGDAKYFLKSEINKYAGDKDHPEILIKASKALEQVHINQAVIVNDTCKRFGLIHPDLENPPEALLASKTKYWDWYKIMHKKVFGEDIEVVQNPSKPDLKEEGEDNS